MPIRTVPGTDVQYYLIAFDKRGAERSEEGGKLSERIVQELRTGACTDVFVISHGWKGDVPAAIEQYDAWIGAMLACTSDRERARRARPDFRALLIGFHWPSLPFGDEELGAGAAFAAMAGGAVAAAEEEGTAAGSASAAVAEPLVDTWADRIADTPAAREALRTIFAYAARDIEPDEMPREVVNAYVRLDRETGLGADGPAGAPDADREPFDPIASYEDARFEAEDFGGIGLGGLLSPLRQLSFWQMKARARSVGESGGHALLRAIRDAAPGARIHLMGHSFGCIVVSSIVGGPDGADPVPVDTLFLVQGALSLWSYSSDIPVLPGRPGYFRRVLEGRVRGPIVTTRSRFDTAVRVLYPKAAGIAGQVVFDTAKKEFPRYGGVGTFGLQGGGVETEDLPVGPVDARYDFRPGRVYNLDADGVIRNGGGASGAHSDIAHPEVAHAFWSAVLAGQPA